MIKKRSVLKVIGIGLSVFIFSAVIYGAASLQNLNVTGNFSLVEQLQ